MKHAVVLLLLASACAATVPPPRPAPASPAAVDQSKTIAAHTANLTKIDGFVPLFWDEENGRLLMQISRFGEEMLYQVSLPAGLGANAIGLDRGALGATHIIRFERVGPRVLMVEPNMHYRATSSDPNERRAVEDSFARSILAGFKVEAAEGGSVLVDATEFFLGDQCGVARAIRDAQQGSYALDRNRSAIYLPHTKAFPRNTEVETTLTFETPSAATPLVSSVAPVGEIITIREHHSLVALPGPGYTPRRFDPRVGLFPLEIYDYASPFTAPLETRWIERHRLEKKDPSAAISEPVQPIVYYVDNGVPEPIRSALVEGASWWSEAFEAAGFKNAWIVKVLPDGADPMDVRYNMINWVHRSTRGWSYGAAVADPRTGEIIKGNVLLGSLRIRQDMLIARGLIPQYAEDDDEVLSQLDPKTSPSLMALARIRQLAAHEVGHTLGLDHNMAGSSYGRASVMDYPSPRVKITDGKLDLSDAYARGIGAYDKFAIQYAYSQFASGTNEDAALDALVREQSPGMLFVKDADSRSVSGAHPLGSVWDGEGDPVASLQHEIEVRRIALEQFGLRNLAVGEPLSSLEEKLLPLYLHHRFQLEAAAKSIGGLDYTYAVKEKGSIVPAKIRSVVAPAQQRAAIAALLSTLEPKFLQLPQRIIDLIPPRAYGYEGGIAERFESHTVPAFDPIAAATSCADITVSALLNSQRDARLVELHVENEANPSMAEVADALVDVSMRNERGYAGAITRATRNLLAQRLMDLAADRDADSQVRAEASAALRRFSGRLVASVGDESEQASRRAVHDDIERFLARPAESNKTQHLPAIPPGPPI